jgi:hypothetical protein
MSGAGDDLAFAQSPPNMEGPIMFVAPELAEETLMDVSAAFLNFLLYVLFSFHRKSTMRLWPS